MALRPFEQMGGNRWESVVGLEGFFSATFSLCLMSLHRGMRRVLYKGMCVFAADFHVKELSVIYNIMCSYGFRQPEPSLLNPFNFLFHEESRIRNT